MYLYTLIYISLSFTFIVSVIYTITMSILTDEYQAFTIFSSQTEHFVVHTCISDHGVTMIFLDVYNFTAHISVLGLFPQQSN